MDTVTRAGLKAAPRPHRWVTWTIAAVVGALVVGGVLLMAGLRSCDDAVKSGSPFEDVGFCENWPAGGVRFAPTPSQSTAGLLSLYRVGMYDKPKSKPIARDLAVVTAAFDAQSHVNKAAWAAAQPNLQRVNAYAKAHC